MAAGSQHRCSALPISYSRSVAGVPAVSLPSSQQLWGRRAMVVTPMLVGQHPPALCLMAVLTGGPCVGSGQRAGAVSWRCYSRVPAACLPCPGRQPSGSFREGQPIAAAAHPSLQPAREARSWPLLAACPTPLGKGRAPPKPPELHLGSEEEGRGLWLSLRGWLQESSPYRGVAEGTAKAERGLLARTRR